MPEMFVTRCFGTTIKAPSQLGPATLALMPYLKAGHKVSIRDRHGDTALGLSVVKGELVVDWPRTHRPAWVAQVLSILNNTKESYLP